MDRLLVEAGIAEALLDRAHGVAEIVHAELLEAGARERAREINALEEGIDLDRGLRRRRQRTLGALALRAETADRAVVAREVLAAVLALEVLDAEIDNTVVEILTTQM